MKARINPTGTHVQNGFLKVRVDLYPDPADKTYALHYVDHFDREPTEAELADPAKLALVPVHQELNPCLCHFIAVPGDITREQLLACLEQLFTPDCLATLDEALLLKDAIHRVSPFMRSQPKMAAAVVPASDREALVAAVNARLDRLELKGEKGNPEDIEPESIDVGPGAIDRANSNTPVYTYVDGNNPANASGTLDTFSLWFGTNATGVKVGTGYGSGTVYTNRDGESLGNVTSGSMQTFTGLDCDVESGDYAMFYFGTGFIEADTTGGTTCYYKSGDWFAQGQQTFSTSSRQAHSIYGTGTESGGAKTSSDSGQGAEAAVAAVSLVAVDAGQGVEYARILGLWEARFSGDAGRGSDSLRALAVRSGLDTGLRAGPGRVGLPNKEVKP
jgi:hypothetical protein